MTKKNRIKRIRNRVRTIIIMAISPIYILIAQEVAEYNAKISKVFQHVDKSRVTTGLLYDYGLHLIDPVYYDGVALTDENYIDMERSLRGDVQLESKRQYLFADSGPNECPNFK
ncbi:hypothetical protein Tanf_12185 [Tannerella forsythia]|nr:hypothetical protein Tanf_12185 [Tannerella forsythia]